MRYREFVTELRKNPDQNPKVTVNSEIYQAIDKAGETADTIADIRNLFVTFTSIDKLGINPRSNYHTPLGIYSYPATYIRKYISDGSMRSLPFAGHSKYATIFKAKGNIINLVNISESEVNLYFKKIKLYMKNKSGKDWKTVSDEIDAIIDKSMSNDSYEGVDLWMMPSEPIKYSSFPGARLWYVTREVSSMIASDKPRGTVPANSLAWNNLFRSIGITGCVDAGIGIIHSNEPTQAVFFDIGAVTVIKQVNNRENYLPSKIDRKKYDGENTKARLTGSYNKFRNMDLQAQMKAVLDNTKELRFMPNPSREFIDKVLLKEPHAIRWVRNPSEQLQIATVEKDGTAIDSIIKAGIKPSIAVMKAAVKTTPDSIKYINNPPEEIQMDFFHKSIRSDVKIIKNPTEALQLAAVKRDPKNIYIFLQKKIIPSEAVQLATVNAMFDPEEKEDFAAHLLHWGIPVSQKVKNAAGYDFHAHKAKMKKKQSIPTPPSFEELLKSGVKPAEADMVAYVKIDGSLIKNIANAGIDPPESVQIAAVSDNYQYAMPWIKNPTPKVIEMVKIMKSMGLHMWPGHWTTDDLK
jgi:hypothetical protein